MRCALARRATSRRATSRGNHGGVKPPLQSLSLDRALFLKKPFDAAYVFGYIDADRVVFYLGHTNLPAIFQPPELFELFDFFEFTLRKSGVLEERLALEDVQPKVLPIAHMDLLLGVAHPGDRRTRKIKGVGVEIEDAESPCMVNPAQ